MRTLIEELREREQITEDDFLSRLVSDIPPSTEHIPSGPSPLSESTYMPAASPFRGAPDPEWLLAAEAIVGRQLTAEEQYAVQYAPDYATLEAQARTWPKGNALTLHVPSLTLPTLTQPTVRSLTDFNAAEEEVVLPEGSGQVMLLVLAAAIAYALLD